MPDLALRPWPFAKDQEVWLHWLCSPYRDAGQRWLVQAVFIVKGSNTLVTVEYPWGTLPILRLGQTYVSGYPKLGETIARPRELYVPDFQKGEFCQGFNLQPSLYNFFRNQEFGTQNLWRFTVGKTIYFVPCIELLRSFLAPSKTLANQILRPNGLDLLLQENYRFGQMLGVSLSSEIPKTLVNDQTVTHLVWLRYQKAARRAWESVYSEIFAQAIVESPSQPVAKLSRGIPIKLNPPLEGSCHLLFEAVSKGREVLILQILGIRGLEMPFSRIAYCHPSIKQTRFVSAPKRARDSGYIRKAEENLELDESGSSARNETYQDLVEAPATSFSFRNPPELQRVEQGEKVVHTGPPDSKAPTQGGLLITAEKIVSTDEPVYGGDIRPIEFSGLQIVSLRRDTNGLEDFVKAIRHIIQQQKNWSINLSVVELPDTKAFSLLPNGSKRTCAIVQVRQTGHQPCYILEIARPDSWSVSTLFVQQFPSHPVTESIEGVLDGILKGLVEQNGHWDKVILAQSTNVQVSRLKHVTDQFPWRWAERIIEKLGSFGLR